VAFGSTAATAVTVTSTPHQSGGHVPAGSPGQVNVTVTTAGGTSAISFADLFTYNAVPTVSAVAPSSGPLAGGTWVTVTGLVHRGVERGLRGDRRHRGHLCEHHDVDRDVAGWFGWFGGCHGHHRRRDVCHLFG